jgi:hypothetical protein
MFPFSIINIRKYPIKDIGISSEKFLISKFIEHLQPLNFNISDSRDNSFIFHHRFYHLSKWQKQLRLGNGIVKVWVENEFIIFKIKSYFIWEFCYVLISSSIPIIFETNITSLKTGIFVFVLLFIPVFLLRYLSHKKLANDFNKIVIQNKS